MVAGETSKSPRRVSWLEPTGSPDVDELLHHGPQDVSCSFVQVGGGHKSILMGRPLRFKRVGPMRRTGEV